MRIADVSRWLNLQQKGVLSPGEHARLARGGGRLVRLSIARFCLRGLRFRPMVTLLHDPGARSLTREWQRGESRLLHATNR